MDKDRRVLVENKPVENPKNFMDVTGLVRSLQRMEGNSDCFRRWQNDCDQTDCCWRTWCLMEVQKPDEEGDQS